MYRHSSDCTGAMSFAMPRQLRQVKCKMKLGIVIVQVNMPPLMNFVELSASVGLLA